MSACKFMNKTLSHILSCISEADLEHIITYHNTKQTDKAREQKLRREAAVISKLKRKHNC